MSQIVTGVSTSGSPSPTGTTTGGSGSIFNFDNMYTVVSTYIGDLYNAVAGDASFAPYIASSVDAVEALPGLVETGYYALVGQPGESFSAGVGSAGGAGGAFFGAEAGSFLFGPVGTVVGGIIGGLGGLVLSIAHIFGDFL